MKMFRKFNNLNLGFICPAEQGPALQEKLEFVNWKFPTCLAGRQAERRACGTKS
jgi:hypothetical protein